MACLILPDINIEANQAIQTSAINLRIASRLNKRTRGRIQYSTVFNKNYTAVHLKRRKKEKEKKRKRKEGKKIRKKKRKDSK